MRPSSRRRLASVVEAPRVFIWRAIAQGFKSPSGVEGRSPGKGSGKMKQFVDIDIDCRH